MTVATANPKAPSDMALVRTFFGMKLQEMKSEWTPLSDSDKADLASGLRDGTLTY